MVCVKKSKNQKAGLGKRKKKEEEKRASWTPLLICGVSQKMSGTPYTISNFCQNYIHHFIPVLTKVLREILDNEFKGYVKISVYSHLLACGRLKVKESEGQNSAGVVVGFLTVSQVFKVKFLFVCLLCSRDRSAYSPPLWMSPLLKLLSSITMQKDMTLMVAWIPVNSQRVNTMPTFSTKSEIAAMLTSSPQPNPSTTQLVELRPS